MLPPKTQPILGVPVASSADRRAPASQMLEPNLICLQSFDYAQFRWCATDPCWSIAGPQQELVDFTTCSITLAVFRVPSAVVDGILTFLRLLFMSRPSGVVMENTRNFLRRTAEARGASRRLRL
jgi:hypothetical protein